MLKKEKVSEKERDWRNHRTRQPKAIPVVPRPKHSLLTAAAAAALCGKSGNVLFRLLSGRSILRTPTAKYISSLVVFPTHTQSILALPRTAITVRLWIRSVGNSTKRTDQGPKQTPVATDLQVMLSLVSLTPICGPSSMHLGNQSITGSWAEQTKSFRTKHNLLLSHLPLSRKERREIGEVQNRDWRKLNIELQGTSLDAFKANNSFRQLFPFFTLSIHNAVSNDLAPSDKVAVNAREASDYQNKETNPCKLHLDFPCV